jgi:hypothetical protein
LSDSLGVDNEAIKIPTKDALSITLPDSIHIDSENVSLPEEIHQSLRKRFDWCKLKFWEKSGPLDKMLQQYKPPKEPEPPRIIPPDVVQTLTFCVQDSEPTSLLDMWSSITRV